MRILFTGTSYPESDSDWKGLFIRRMVEALARRDDLKLRTWLPPGPLPTNAIPATTASDDAFLQGLMEAGGVAHLLRRHRLRGLMAAAGLLLRQRRAFARSNAEVFHLNWLQNALALPRDDHAALLTVLGTDMQLLRLPGMRSALRRALRGRRVAICPNADWMLPTLQQAFGDIAWVRCVPFGIDTCWYEVDRRFETSQAPRWLCVSRLTQAKLGPLFEWTEPAFAHGRAELHLFGPMQEQVALPPWVRWHGAASPAELCGKWFPTAHGLITLSRHAEGRPQVMLEALAAGLPIIASRLPAHDDLLHDGEGGILCGSATETLSALDVLSDPRCNRALGEAGRARMRAHIGTWDDCADRYATLYRQVLQRATA